MDALLDAARSQTLIDDRTLQARAARYALRCERWIDRLPPCHVRSSRDAPMIVHLALVMREEVHEAVADTAGPARAANGDAYTSAAVALIAIDQSRRTWLRLVRGRHVRAVAAEPFVSDLVWLKHELRRAFPGLPKFPGS